MEGDQKKQWQRAALRAAHCAVPPPSPRSALGADVEGCRAAVRKLRSISGRLPASAPSAPFLATLRVDYTPVQFFCAWWHGAVYRRLAECDVCLYRALCSFVAKAGRDGTEKRSAEAYRLVVAFEILCGTVGCALLEEVAAQMLMF